MDKKRLIIPGDNRLESSQNLHQSGLVGAAHEMFQSGHCLGISSNMTSGAMSNLHPPLSSFGAESNLHELLAHAGSHAQSVSHPSNHPSDFLASLGEGVLGESSDNHMYHRQLEVPKQKWTSPTKLSPGPFWMLPHHLDPANYPLPGLALSGTSTPKTSVGPSAVEEPSSRQVWCERGANQVLMKSEDNVATLKLPMVVKPDRSVLCDGSGAPVDSPKGANGNLISARDGSDMEAKQLDSSDCSDHNMDEPEEKDQAQPNGVGKTVSKNLVSERKRRKKLNDGLYTLRALVPKISKMDKASIVGDAIDYVRELQKQVEELQADISDIESAKPTTGPGGEESLSSVVEPSSAQGSEALTNGRSWEQDDNRSAEAKPSGQEMTEAVFEDTTEQKILELDVAKMEEQTYHLRIFCTKGPGVFVQLMQSLEALGLEIRNANLTSFQENLLNTFIAEIKDWEMMKTEEVKKAILDVAARFGLQP